MTMRRYPKGCASESKSVGSGVVPCRKAALVAEVWGYKPRRLMRVMRPTPGTSISTMATSTTTTAPTTTMFGWFVSECGVGRARQWSDAS